jgi:hypothetical protein
MITVSKELLLNLGNFSNIKIIASISSDKENFEESWKQVNQQVSEQEALEKATRLNPQPTTTPSLPPKGWKNTKEETPF